MRGVRFLLEYAKAEEHLRAWRIRSTVVVFGSARVMPGGSRDPKSATAPLPPGVAPRPGPRSAHWYEEARLFYRIASERGGALTDDEAPRQRHRDGRRARDHGGRQPGAYEAGAPSIGFNITLATRAGAERLFDAGPDLPLPLLRHAQDAPRHARQRARVFPGGLDARRAVRDPDAAPDRQGRRSRSCCSTGPIGSG